MVLHLFASHQQGKGLQAHSWYCTDWLLTSKGKQLWGPLLVYCTILGLQPARIRIAGPIAHAHIGFTPARERIAGPTVGLLHYIGVTTSKIKDCGANCTYWLHTSKRKDCGAHWWHCTYLYQMVAMILQQSCFFMIFYPNFRNFASYTVFYNTPLKQTFSLKNVLVLSFTKMLCFKLLSLF